ncbi:MAG: DUF6504 family protein [Candidatus Dormibacteria bacterium]
MSAIKVRVGGAPSRPLAVNLGRGWIEVAAVVERWRVEVGWWRVIPERPVRRDCWRVLLQDGRCLDLRLELGSRRWRLERCWG